MTRKNNIESSPPAAAATLLILIYTVIYCIPQNMSSHSLAAAKRLRKELQVLTKQGPDNDIHLQLTSADNLLDWKAWIRGPSETPFEGGVFQLDIKCGTDYPLAPPSMVFVTKVRR
jgi:ubiquitin-protein ligase